jgi:16S rRNA G966 N2-methylase RsmD
MKDKKIINKIKNTKTIPWSELKTWEFNDLKDGNRDVKKLKNSIVNDGFIAPIFIWHEHQYVIDGTGRNLALTSLEGEGYTIDDLPVVEIEAKTKQEAKAIVLKISSKYGSVTEKSWLDFSVDLDVQSLLSTINIPDINIDQILKRQKKKTDPDQVPMNPPARAKIGDLYQLGEHILICGDSTDFKTVEVLMAGSKAHMVFTDPPYNVDYKGKGANTQNGILNDKMSDSEFDTLLDAVFSNLKNFVGGGCRYVYFS